MTRKEMMNLYQNNFTFKLYMDRMCNNLNKKPRELFDDIVVQAYAKSLVGENEDTKNK